MNDIIVRKANYNNFRLLHILKLHTSKAIKEKFLGESPKSFKRDPTIPSISSFNYSIKITHVIRF